MRGRRGLEGGWTAVEEHWDIGFVGGKSVDSITGVAGGTDSLLVTLFHITQVPAVSSGLPWLKTHINVIRFLQPIGVAPNDVHLCIALLARIIFQLTRHKIHGDKSFITPPSTHHQIREKWSNLSPAAKAERWSNETSFSSTVIQVAVQRSFTSKIRK